MKKNPFHFLPSIVISFILAAGSLLGAPWPAQAAAEIVVNTAVDEPLKGATSSCSLREAIKSANTGTSVGGCTTGVVGADTIILPANIGGLPFAVTGASYEESAVSGDLDITEALTIEGAGADQTIVESDGNDRVFHVYKKTKTQSTFQVTLQDMTITGGVSPADGGGILNKGAVLVLRSVVVTGNQAVTHGGGVRNKIDLVNEVNSTLRIYSSTISNNGAPSGDGGGLDSDATLEISGSTISGNTAKNGGGISNNAQEGNTAVIKNSTITLNTVTNNGGGIYTAGIVGLTILHSTITANTAGVGLFVAQSVTLKNTIIAGNASGNCNNPSAALVVSNGGNLEDDPSAPLNSSCALTAGEVVAPANLLLGPLGIVDGGETAYYPLTSGSAAIDGGVFAGVFTEQREGSFYRPADGDGDGTATVDVGSYEYLGDTVEPPYKIFAPFIAR